MEVSCDMYSSSLLLLESGGSLIATCKWAEYMWNMCLPCLDLPIFPLCLMRWLCGITGDFTSYTAVDWIFSSLFCLCVRECGLSAKVWKRRDQVSGTWLSVYLMSYFSRFWQSPETFRQTRHSLLAFEQVWSKALQWNQEGNINWGEGQKSIAILL